MKKFLLIIAGIIILGSAAHAATVCFPFQGCTGTGTAPRAGQVLIGNSSSTYTPAYLTAGSNITISTSSGAITISSTGGSGGSTATTTINGVNGPTFTFNISGINGLSYSTSTGVITLTQATSSASQAGFLSAADWTTFNGKQAAGNYITGLTGDGTASGPGSVAFTLATVNSNIGTFGSSTTIPILTVTAKGLVTAVSTTSISTTTPGGSNTQVQFNDGGFFGGDSRFLWNKAASGGLSVTAPDGAIDPASVGGRIDLVSGFGGDNIDQGYTPAGFHLTGGNGDDQEGGSIGGEAGSSVIDGDGGFVSFQAGNGGTNSGSGGSVSLIAGNAQGGDGDGGNIQIQSGDKNESGNSGYVSLSTPNNEKQLFLQEGYGFAIYTGGSANALLNASDLNSDRNFSFPDHEGAFVISTTTPTTASDTCSPGQVSYSTTHFYVCVATDTWKRAALSTF